MPNLGGPELIIILVIFMLLFGAKKLPDLAEGVGKSIRSFKKGVSEAHEDDEDPAARRDGRSTETPSARDK